MIEYLNDVDLVNNEKSIGPYLWGYQEAQLMVRNLMWILAHCDKPMEWKHKHNFMVMTLVAVKQRRDPTMIIREWLLGASLV